jgi:hypothetical protein
MGKKILGEEEGEIPVRLEVRVAAPADQIKLVLIAVDELRLGMGVALAGDEIERQRGEHVVIVEEGDEFACR